MLFKETHGESIVGTTESLGMGYDVSNGWGRAVWSLAQLQVEKSVVHMVVLGEDRSLTAKLEEVRTFTTIR